MLLILRGNIMLDYTLEKEMTDQGYSAVCGVDEAGRGPLCAE